MTAAAMRSVLASPGVVGTLRGLVAGELGLSERVGEGTFVAAGGLEGDEAGLSAAAVLDEGAQAVRGGLESGVVR